jgi:glycosyltransferase involved in cell wall biosynthesis
MISVVIPFYNAERFLSACLDALESQTVERCKYEIILVNNNSTDDSVAVAKRHCDVTLLSQPVTGSYAARNMGIVAARGDIIATLDPDCRPDPDWLEQIIAGMEDSARLVLLGHQRHANASEAMALLEEYEAEKVDYVTRNREKNLYFAYTNNMAFRRDVFESIGLFPERVRGGDTIFIRRVVDAFGCDAVAFNPAMKVTHLELDTLNAYYRKRVIYGQSNERISQVMPFRPLRNRERWAVFRSIARKGRLTWRKKLLLLALLAPGALLYEGGRRRGMLKWPSGKKAS